MLWLDDELIANNDDNHSLKSVESSDIQLIGGGRYPIRVRWFNAAVGGAALYLEWQTPTAAGYAAVPANVFTPS